MGNPASSRMSFAIYCCRSGVTSDRILRSKGERERVCDAPAMISVLRTCPKCGAEIPADAPEGGCPGCLLESGLRLLDEEAVVPQPRDDLGQPDQPARAVSRSERFAEVLGELATTNCSRKSVAAVRAWCFAPGKKSQSHRCVKGD
jgi:hypothetical protein